jgi:hypothetical protein
MPGLMAVWALPALADPQALSTFVPVQTQDALAVPYGTFEIQGYGVYTWDHYNSHGRNLLNLSPTLKLGPLPGLQLNLSAPYRLGDQSTANQGDVSADAFYQFTDPRPNFPALALQGGYQFAEYGAGHRSNQYFLRALATQWLGDSDKAPRLHLNLNWTHVTQPSSTGRSDILEINLAYSQLVSDSTALVLDVVHGAKATVRQNHTVIDAGLRHEIGQGWAVGGGVGVGLGQQSPGFRVIFGVQKSFHLF